MRKEHNKMDENNLSCSMSQSITEECSELVSSIAEATLDPVFGRWIVKRYSDHSKCNFYLQIRNFLTRTT